MGDTVHLHRQARLGLPQAGLVAVIDHCQFVAKLADAGHEVGCQSALRRAEARRCGGLLVDLLIDGKQLIDHALPVGEQLDALVQDAIVQARAHEARDYPTAARLLTEHVANYGSVTENRGRAGFWGAIDADRAGNKPRALALFRALLLRYGAGWYGVNAERRIRELESQGVRAASPESDLVLRRFIEGMQSVRLPQESIDEANLARVRRAEQLMRIALYQSASNELDAARAAVPESPLVNLRIAQIFRAQGEPVAAINALKRSYPDYGQTLPQEMSRECWEVFYPLRYWTNIREEARRHGIDPYFIAGLIRQETVFDPKARSRANALGLMQLLPYVGQSVARKTTGASITSNDLFNPVLNIQLGTAFVKEQIDSFGRWEYVAAAYNGGPTRVRRWIKELPATEIEEWVEAIPLSETRLYVQGVYRNARQYQRLYDEQGRFRSIVPE